MEKDKGQKLIAAIYLATGHLSDSDPFKKTLREKSMELVDFDTRTRAAEAIDTILGASVIAKVLSEKNASIISFEMHRLISPVGAHTEDAVSQMFVPQTTSIPKLPTQTPNMSFKTPRPFSETSKHLSVKETIENKSKRQEAILSFINTRKSAVIKDISTLFPELSEKTIQRELGALVTSGKITKRGSKRWSIYMAVGA